MQSIGLTDGTGEWVDRPAVGGAEGPVAPFLASARSALGSARVELDAFEPEGRVAVSLLASVAEIVKMATSLKLSLTASISVSGACREVGHRNAASLVAELEGIPVGAAGAVVATANRLKECPEADDAMRKGQLSEAQARLITAAAILAPDREGDLVESATTKSITELSDDCRRVRASSAKADPMATYRRIHEARSLRQWTDEEGALCLQGRFTPDVGAKVAASIEAVAGELFETARKAGSRVAPPGLPGRRPGRPGLRGAPTGARRGRHPRPHRPRGAPPWTHRRRRALGDRRGGPAAGAQGA